MKQTDAPAVDICLLLEGTYPYVSGGVSTWVHQIITAMPQVTFGIFYIGSEKGEDTSYKYEIPENVLVLEELYLFERTPTVKKRAVPASWNAIYALLRNLFELAPRGDAQELSLMGPLADHLLRHPGIAFEDFYHAPQTWSVLQEVYERYAPEESFLHFFWTARYLIEPLWKLMHALPRIPQAKVYHTACTGYAGFLGALVAQQQGRPLILSEHGIYLRERIQDIWRSRWIQDSLTLHPSLTDSIGTLRQAWMRTFDVLGRWCYHQSAHVISLFNRNAAIQHHFGADLSRIRVIPNGIAVEACEPLYQQRLERRKANATSRVVGFLGRIVPIKDVKTLLRAARRVCDALPDTQFLLAGPLEEAPDYARECTQLATQLGLKDQVHFLGLRQRDEVLPLMDVMALTSVSEGLPFVMLEAMACGIPIVSTDVGACRELLEGQPAEQPRLSACGLVTEVGDSDQMAQALIALLVSHEIQDRLGLIGRERVYRSYHESRTLGAYWEMYRNLAHAEATAPASTPKEARPSPMTALPV
ncbi:glycosyltransferase involved in cell wall biosynthesis [Roseimicrobium gellanilyticum]|uniref:Glycosyltransferase involved in cell wall biosynthesis n=1 Tax=Roseimicrobium gellanilyticum TaxID=748857 RepID=A0A366HT98_9BACT|nr:GT4 family glycosyltransferase PelF [Roseimicrobium gellanilyticum]RBP47511.1 glycosyltransferase involved in cell wall biosynthesis [Roseimicrobium gellanilyticum]